MKRLFFVWIGLLFTVAIPRDTLAQTATQLALDGPGLSWFATLGGPTTVVTNTHDGVDAWMTGNHCTPTNGNCNYDNSTAILRTSVTGPGTLRFWWKVSCEEGFDAFSFWIGGYTVADSWELQITGWTNSAWTQAEVLIPEGTQTLEWIYTKDDSASEGADRGWVDEVFFTPDPPAITNQPSEDITLAPVGTNVSFTVGYRGNPAPLVFWQFNSTNLVGKTNATLTLTNLQVAQSGEYRAIVTNIYGSATSEVAVLEVFQPVLLEWGLDTTGLVWSTSGDALWFGQADGVASHDGIDVTRSGVPPEDFEQLSFESKISTRVNGPGTLKFWWRLAGLETDLLQLYIQGINQNILPPDDGSWEEKIITVESGTNRLIEWIYDRDDFIDTDDTDGGFLDQVTYIPATNSPPIFSLPSYSTNGFSATIQLDPFRGYHIQSSTNMTSWVDVTNFTSSESLYQFVDGAATNIGRRYYRVKSP